MNKPLEASIERKFCTAARREGCLALKFADPARRGAPDRIVLCPAGRAFFVEFKRPGEIPRREQREYHNRLALLGFKVYVCSSVESAVEALFAELLR